MTYRSVVIAGDGAGPEVVAEARKAVDALGVALEWSELDWGTQPLPRQRMMAPRWRSSFRGLAPLSGRRLRRGGTGPGSP
jgi:isocitrate/isopropylmalate dehydrogenase